MEHICPSVELWGYMLVGTVESSILKVIYLDYSVSATHYL